MDTSVTGDSGVVVVSVRDNGITVGFIVNGGPVETVVICETSGGLAVVV